MLESGKNPVFLIFRIQPRCYNRWTHDGYFGGDHWSQPLRVNSASIPARRIVKWSIFHFRDRCEASFSAGNWERAGEVEKERVRPKKPHPNITC
jgi:hypothetical protein